MEKKQIIKSLQTILAKDCFIPNKDEFTRDRRNRFDSNPLIILEPKNLTQLIKLVKFANKSQTPIVTQGGNTSLQAGAITNNKGNQILLLTTGLSRIISVDKINSSIILEAGVFLPLAQKYAAKHGLIFPQMLGANINSTIGGNIATNAGGVFAKRFGNTRNILLGLEVVGANGEIVSNLKEVYKDNCGYDLKQLFIGSEGTLGIITKASFKLSHYMPNRFFFLAKLANLSQLTNLYHDINQKFESQILAFEMICCKLICLAKKKSDLNLKNCCDDTGYYFILILDRFLCKDDIFDKLKQVIDKYPLKDVRYEFSKNSDENKSILCQKQSYQSEIWNLREQVITVQAKTGYSIKHDISIKISDIAHFVESTSKIIYHYHKNAQILPFGHFGDGNLHFNISLKSSKNLQTSMGEISRLVYENVIAYNGSIAAEHGIGRLKKELIAKQKGDVSLKYMKKIKKVFDPKNIFNPDVIV